MFLFHSLNNPCYYELCDRQGSIDFSNVYIVFNVFTGTMFGRSTSSTDIPTYAAHFSIPKSCQI